MTKTSNTQNLNKIIEFRQALYEHGFSKESAALFETLDALLLSGSVPSFPHLSLQSIFQRKWPSLYKGLQRGRLNTDWIITYLADKLVPHGGVQCYSLDSTAWVRPRAETLDQRSIVRVPAAGTRQGHIYNVGYEYSLLDWVPQAGRSWSMSVDVARVPFANSVIEIGIEQVQRLNQVRQKHTDTIDIVAGDARYGNERFYEPLQGGHCGLVARMRKDRVLHFEQPSGDQKPQGRPAVHGQRFAFKEPQDWPEPDERHCFEDQQFGQVVLERWNRLHGRRHPNLHFDVIRASVYQERDKSPVPIWLMWQAPAQVPHGTCLDAVVIWRAFLHRWPIEPNIRFRKQALNWTIPQFHHKTTGDKWSWLVALAVWFLFLSKDLITDQPFPWQKPQAKLTPQRVLQSLPLLFVQFGTPVTRPKVRGIPPGWPRGQPRTQKQRFPVLKKSVISA